MGKVHPGTCKPRGLVGCVSPDLVNNTCQHPSEFESILPRFARSGVALPFGNGDSSTGRNEALAAAANSFFYDLSKELLTSASSSSAMPASLAEHLNELGLYHVVAPHFIGIVPAPVSSPNSIPQLNLGLGFGSREGFCGELELKKTSLPQTFSLEQEWIELTQLRLLLALNEREIPLVKSPSELKTTKVFSLTVVLAFIRTPCLLWREGLLRVVRYLETPISKESLLKLKGRVPVQALSDLFEDPLFDGSGVGSLVRRELQARFREGSGRKNRSSRSEGMKGAKTRGLLKPEILLFSIWELKVAKSRRLIFLIRNLSIGGAQPSFKPQSPARDVKPFSMSSTRPVDPGGKGNPLIESIPDDAPLTITRPTYSPNATRLFRGMAFNPISIYAPPRPEGGLNPIPSSIPLSGKRTKRRARRKERANPIKNIWWIRIPTLTGTGIGADEFNVHPFFPLVMALVSSHCHSFSACS
ncbi:hypothetical protein ACH5RR_018403 [Cinchona calisaya]|uniref:Uncharacterized protein n=1 Tax=Cinchona calisaya TaxID=153742 RepID=A0ABD2ZLW2_9GENT